MTGWQVTDRPLTNSCNDWQTQTDVSVFLTDGSDTDGRLIDSDSCQEFVGTDAAPDELKAMRLSKGMKLRNIKVRVRDGAHAAGRQELHQSVHVTPHSFFHLIII